MKKLRGLAILMVVAILGITGFQVYWLKENYAREQKSLNIKTDQAFRSTINQLQVSKLKLDGILPSDKEAGLKVFVTDEGRDHLPLPKKPGNQEMISTNKEIVSTNKGIVSTINIIREKLKDSLKNGLIISMKKSGIPNDTIHFRRRVNPPGEGKDYILDLLYGVDSLQDTLKLAEIKTAYAAKLKKQKLEVPFTVERSDSAIRDENTEHGSVTVGFAKPITFNMRLGNTFPYLMRQIMQPILFSLLLLGVTILTFVLLYRTLLKQHRLAALKNEFISNITHELKTPIATVGVAIEALKNFNAIHDPQRTKEYLDISANELQRLGLLVDKVLRLSMFEKKEIELEYEQLDLHAMVEEVVGSFKLQSEKYHATITVTRDGDTSIEGDRMHLLSVIFNLVDNALKYSNGDPLIHIDLREAEDNVVMKVSDNGIGIAPEYRDKIFEKFFRIPHGDTHNAKGYGLGLSYAAQVIQKHKGAISVESAPGKGTTFTIILRKTKNG